ncbi:PHP domain-containing protein [Sporomusa sp. KB1]|jgi:predicted metal-dependent phosphoesterase TrpH|uniref:PHP domain-containing protein n=1 Tax=Sporomusa sp. KB1 TaxID=943346 RepID=UPI00119EC921|nr:PHP domain-containing protein [Sporomusa sp. KB1]TWH51626.1 hypothetical protein Salpa_0068 [Sporomusa sp. KB1]TWH52205.1 hypothetical protein Salpa_0727 [Sporomusa sp. KB1]
MKRINMDCHVHTSYSRDCGIKIADLLRLCPARGLDAVAITDHNTIRGALELREQAPFKVVVGEEINTLQGEIIGYFLQQEIPPGLSALATVQAIREQGGLVCVPHPFDRWRKSAIGYETLTQIIGYVDIIEAYNARNVFNQDNKKAARFASQQHKPISVGSDCHTAWEIGCSYVVIGDFSDAATFLGNLANSLIKFTKSSIMVHCYTKLFKAKCAIGLPK